MLITPFALCVEFIALTTLFFFQTSFYVQIVSVWYLGLFSSEAVQTTIHCCEWSKIAKWVWLRLNPCQVWRQYPTKDHCLCSQTLPYYQSHFATVQTRDEAKKDTCLFGLLIVQWEAENCVKNCNKKHTQNLKKNCTPNMLQTSIGHLWICLTKFTSITDFSTRELSACILNGTLCVDDRHHQQSASLSIIIAYSSLPCCWGLLLITVNTSNVLIQGK